MCLPLDYRNGDSRLTLAEIVDPVIRLVQFLVNKFLFYLSVIFVTSADVCFVENFFCKFQFQFVDSSITGGRAWKTVGSGRDRVRSSSSSY